MCDATLVFPCKVPLHLGHSRVTIWGFEHIRDLSDLSRFIIGCSLYDRVVVSVSGRCAGWCDSAFLANEDLTENQLKRHKPSPGPKLDINHLVERARKIVAIRSNES
jgi:hypothetical protein